MGYARLCLGLLNGPSLLIYHAIYGVHGSNGARAGIPGSVAQHIVSTCAGRRVYKHSILPSNKSVPNNNVGMHTSTDTMQSMACE